jgi:ferric-dicitrate binding protein FerR (iron transport regulator)
MKDYRLFDIADFVMDEDFIRWVHKDTKADNDFWNNWLNQNPGKHMMVAEARRILQSLAIEEKTTTITGKETEISKLLLTIKKQPLAMESNIPQSLVPVVSASRKWWYVAAAVLLIATSFTVYLLKTNQRPQQFAYSVITPSKHLIESVNTSEKSITIKLPDESNVELSPDSRIAYANNFDSSETRDVYLSGEAFFQVTKNPARPFRVFANEIVTKVLGTSFFIRSFENDTIIQVTVRTGKVSVYSQSADNVKQTKTPNRLGGIILTPNQELVYKKANQEFRKTLLEQPEVINDDVASLKNMLYDDTPVVQVFNQLSKIYGINIVYDDQLLKKCTVTGDLRNEVFYKKLDLICKAIGANYEIIDGQVIIQTNGCE